jgi:hypothetical protein
MHIFQSMILPLVERELVTHETEIGRVVLTQLHGLLTKFIVHVDKHSGAAPIVQTEEGAKNG